jgi:chemotaxis protein methyltransferase CheR
VKGAVAFPGYQAKAPAKPRRFDSVRKAYRFVRSYVYDVGSYPYGAYRHRALLRSSDRLSTHTWTCFYRAPAQLRALSGPVLDFLGNPQRSGERFDILLLACSSGAEVYTIASWLMQRVPGLNFHIHASDLHDELVEYARAGKYTADEVLHSEYIGQPFIHATFEQVAGSYIVRPEIRAKASFRQANLLDGDGLRKQFGTAPLVIAQNVLFHLSPPRATTAFENLVSLMAPRSVLLMEGMDLGLRSELTARHGLRPLATDARQIYEETRVHTPRDWWNYYWGMEPYTRLHPDRERRYATIFLRDSAAPGSVPYR